MKTNTEIVHKVVLDQIMEETVTEENREIHEIIEELEGVNPDVKDQAIKKVTVEHIGTTTICEIDYEQLSITVVKEEGENIEVVSTETIPEEIEYVTLETQVTEEGNHIVVSNKVEKIAEMVPEVTTAIVKVSQVITTNIEEIKSISVNIEQNSYTFISVNEEGKTTEVEFVYNTESQEVLIVDVQETSQPISTTKPVELTYETVEITSKPEIVTAVRENKDIEIVEIVEVKKSSANLVQEYSVEVTTTDHQKAVITIEEDWETHRPQIVDIFKYVEEEQVAPVEVVEMVNPITQVTETTYPTPETFVFDECYNEIEEFLHEDIRTHNITSIVKEHYGSNDEYSILLKS